jgi:hypothetical protein
MPLRVINRTHYDTGDLTRLFERGFRALKLDPSKVVEVRPTKGDSRGIAWVGRCKAKRCETKSMVLKLPPPANLTMRRLSRLFEHEAMHLKGYSHEDMSEKVYWSSQDTVAPWARGVTLRWRGPKARRGRLPVKQSPAFDKREGQEIERALGRLPEMSPTRFANSPSLLHAAAVAVRDLGGWVKSKFSSSPSGPYIVRNRLGKVVGRFTTKRAAKAFVRLAKRGRR